MNQLEQLQTSTLAPAEPPLVQWEKPEAEKSATPRVAAIYARYSTDNQKATSIADQVAACQEHAERHGFTVSPEHIYTDFAQSGGSLGGRDGFKAFMQQMHAGAVHVLITWSQSRLFRNVEDSQRFLRSIQAKGLRVLTVDGTDTDREGFKLPWQFVSLMDEQYREGNRAAVVRGQESATARGFMVSRPPYGYKLSRSAQSRSSVGATFEICPTASQFVRFVFSERASGKTLPEIAEELRKKGARTSGGGIWGLSQLAYMLQNPLYSGSYCIRTSERYKREHAEEGARLGYVVELPHLAIVSPEQWEAAQPVKGERRQSRRRVSATRLVSGLVSCGHCGRTLTPKIAGARSTPVEVGRYGRFVAGSALEGEAMHVRASSLVCVQCTGSQEVGASGEPFKQIRGGVLVAVLSEVLRHELSAPGLGEQVADYLGRFASHSHAQLLEEAERVYSVKVKLTELSYRRFKGVLEGAPDFGEVPASVEYEDSLAEEARALEDLNTLKRHDETKLLEAVQAQGSISPTSLLGEILGEPCTDKLRTLLRVAFPFLQVSSRGDASELGAHLVAYRFDFFGLLSYVTQTFNLNANQAAGDVSEVFAKTPTQKGEAVRVVFKGGSYSLAAIRSEFSRPPEGKECTGCGGFKPIEEFHPYVFKPSASSNAAESVEFPTYYRSQCIECTNEKRRTRHGGKADRSGRA